MNPAPLAWFYVYLLKSKKDGSFYIGCTSNLQKRLEEHKNGKCYSTRKILPIEVIYVEAYKSKKDAYNREKQLKCYGNALRNLKIRIKHTLERGAG